VRIGAGFRPRRPADAPAPTCVPVPRALRLRKVTVLVPDSSVEGLREFACDLCRRQEVGTSHVAGQWRKLSPSAEVIVILRAAQAVRSGTLELPPGPDRYHWAVTLLGEPDPVAAGRAGELAEARALAQEALAAAIRRIARAVPVRITVGYFHRQSASQMPRRPHQP